MDLNPSAARSLAEGMEETLTVHRLYEMFHRGEPLTETVWEKLMHHMSA